MDLKNFYQILVTLIVVAEANTMAYPSQRGTCEDVKTPICKDMGNGAKGWVKTSFPNFANHTVQEQAIHDLEQYSQLIQKNCAPELRIFLCSVYIPMSMCTPTLHWRISPCRSLCEASRKGCEPVLNKFGYHWPDILDCSRFPSQDDGICVGPAKQSSKKKKDKKPKADHVKLLKGESVNLECRYGQKISIRKVRHNPHHKRCCPQTSAALLSNLCNGRKSCAVQITEQMFGHNCEHDLNELSLKFRCVPSSTFVPTRVEVPECKRKVIYKHRT